MKLKTLIFNFLVNKKLKYFYINYKLVYSSGSIVADIFFNSFFIDFILI